MLLHRPLLAFLTLLGAAAPVVAQVGTIPTPSRLAPASPSVPEPLVAEAPIWGPNNAFDGRAYLAVNVQGHPATLFIDLYSPVSDILVGADALAAAGIPLPVGGIWETVTIGHDVQHQVPIGVVSNLGNVPTPPNIAPVIGAVGGHFLATHYDVLYDFPHRVVRLYAPPAKSSTAKTAWLPPGFTPADCGPMVEIPPAAGAFTGVQITLDGHPAVGAIEMGPTYLKMNQAAFALLGVPRTSPRLVPITDDPSAAPAGATQYVTGVQVALPGGQQYELGQIQLWPQVSAGDLLPNHPPVLLMNLSTLRTIPLYTAQSSRQVCLLPPTALPTAPQARLTVDALANMTTFWTAFLQEPDSIKTAGRVAHQEQLLLDLGGRNRFQMPSVVDMVALARAFPATAADLVRAHLTAEEWEQYRAALFAAMLAPPQAATSTASSVLQQNITFLQAHPQEFNALRATGMWFPQAPAPTPVPAPGQAAPPAQDPAKTQ